MAMTLAEFNKRRMIPLISCDTFVCLPPNTAKNSVIFGKNSDRPQGEVQEIVYQPRQTYAGTEKLRCTYIEIDQAKETYAVILSKISWMWGVEMGANEFGVAIGNEAVWTRLNDSGKDLVERLLGMDLVRLGLERGKTAEEALKVMTSLLEKYGQGGPCSDTMKNWSYHNSFLIADRKEAWVLETAGNLWAAEKVESGYRNISNGLSIGTKIDLMSSNLKETALELKLWNGKEPFHFTHVFSDDYGDSQRFLEGKRLLGKYSQSNSFDAKSMMKILRDEDSGICMGCDDSFPSASSQVSVLTPEGDSRPDCHWFTGTPDPQCSVFKPFIFQANSSITKDVSSPVIKPGEPVARLKGTVDRRHELLKAQQKFFRKLEHPANTQLRQRFSELENNCIETVEKLLENVGSGQQEKLENVFDEAVRAEFDFYKCN